MISTSIVLHFNDTLDVRQHLNELGFKSQVNNEDDEILDVFVDDVPYEIFDGTYQEPIKELCSFYGINRDLLENIGFA